MIRHVSKPATSNCQAQLMLSNTLPALAKSEEENKALYQHLRTSHRYTAALQSDLKQALLSKKALESSFRSVAERIESLERETEANSRQLHLDLQQSKQTEEALRYEFDSEKKKTAELEQQIRQSAIKIGQHSSMKQEFEACRDQNEMLKLQLLQSRQTATHCTQQISSLSEEKSQLLAQLAHKSTSQQQHHQQLCHKLSLLEQAHIEAEKIITSLKQELSIKEERIVTLQAQLEEELGNARNLEHDLEKVEKKALEVGEEKEMVIGQRQGMMERLQKMEMLKRGLKEELELTSQEVERLEQIVLEYRKINEQAKANELKIQEKANRLQQELQIKQTLIQELQAARALSLQHLALEQAHHKIEGLQVQLLDKCQELATYKGRLAFYQQEVQHAHAKLANFKEQADMEITSQSSFYRNQQQSFKEQKQALLAELQVWERKFKSNCVQLKATESINKELQDQLNTLRGHLVDLEQALGNYKLQQQRSKTEITLLQEECYNIKRESCQAQQQLAKENTYLEAEMVQLKMRADSLQARAEQAESQLYDTQKEVLRLQEICDEFKSQLRKTEVIGQEEQKRLLVQITELRQLANRLQVEKQFLSAEQKQLEESLRYQKSRNQQLEQLYRKASQSKGR